MHQNDRWRTIFHLPIKSYKNHGMWSAYFWIKWPSVSISIQMRRVQEKRTKKVLLLSPVFPVKASSITTSPPISGWTLISFISTIVRPVENGSPRVVSRKKSLPLLLDCWSLIKRDNFYVGRRWQPQPGNGAVLESKSWMVVPHHPVTSLKFGFNYWCAFNSTRILLCNPLFGI